MDFKLICKTCGFQANDPLEAENHQFDPYGKCQGWEKEIPNPDGFSVEKAEKFLKMIKGKKVEISPELKKQGVTKEKVAKVFPQLAEMIHEQD